MKESLNAYIPRDRLVALASGSDLPVVATGSVLFADISGFTPLTEAFEAHLGSRQGGEELTRILNEVYTVLINEVDRMRGSVIGFAGDAITCWFEGDDGRKAVRCALSMQADMEQFQAVPSPGGGTHALGLKAAVTAGTVRRFVVGCKDLQRVDVLAGDPVYRVAVTEQMAQRGEVVVDEQTRDLLGLHVKVGERRTDEHGSAVSWVVDSLSLEVAIDPWPDPDGQILAGEIIKEWIISSIRKRILSGHGDFFTELRPATAVFVKFSGIDFEGDEDSGRKLDQFFSQVQEIVSAFDGVVHQLTLGDKGSFLYAAFGAPISHEDDTLRAMAVSLKIRDLGESLDYIESVQIGIGRGTNRTGAYGSPTRRTYGVLGDQVNLSARLMGKAKPGQILASESAAREGKQAFQLQPLEPMMVKGKSKPITAFEVKGPLKDKRRSRSSGYALPMVGRAQELARIREFTRSARSGRGQVVSIIAEPGMGKTRLVDEAISAAQADGFRIFRGDCQSFGTNTPYTPWWDIWRDFFGLKGNEEAERIEARLRERLSAIDPNLVPRFPLLAPVLNINIPDNELTRTFEAKLKKASLEGLLIDCLRAASREQPVGIVIEDVHAIDSVSRDLLWAVIQAAARQPVLLLLAHRPSETHKVLGPSEESLEYVHQLPLKEFTRDESAELVRLKFAQLLGHSGEIPAGVLNQIADRTGGNPFFIEEVMNWMHQHQIDFLSEEAVITADLPVSLHALVLSRMDQLDENSRITMKVASVIGRFFRAAILWGVYPQLGGKAPVLNSLGILSQRDFTVVDEEDPELAYLFKHIVIHEVAYESLPRQLRQRLHESIGSFIEEHLPADTLKILDLLAFHFGRSANLDKKKEYLLKAGDAARKNYANSVAVDYYEEVLPLLEKEKQTRILRHLGHVHEISGNWKKAMESYQAALELAEELQNEKEIANCRLVIGDLHRKSGAFEDARKWLSEARQLFEALGNEEGQGKALHSEGTLAAQSGDFDKARTLYNQSLQIRRDLGDDLQASSLLGNIGIILRFQGKDQDALDYQKRSLEIRKKINDPWYLGNSYNNLGMVKRYMGDYSGAQADLEEAIKIFERIGDRSELANTLTSLAELAIEQKKVKDGEIYLQRSLHLSRELGNLQGLAFLLEAFAMNAFFQKEYSRALRLFGASRSLRKTIGAPLPEPEEEKVRKTIEEIGNAHKGDTDASLREGASLPLSTALDYAARMQDADL